jgi:hypothetical protein
MRNLIILTLLMSLNAVAAEDVIRTEATTNSTVSTTSDTTLNSPPPSAIIPTMNFSNSDLCTVGVAGAVQTQILGLSAGATVRDMNCERLKNAKTLFDMGMKVAAVSTMCQDKRVFDAMMNAGTPCPYDGMIGPDAKAAWAAHEDEQPGADKEMSNGSKTFMGGAGLVGLLAVLLVL